MADSPESLPFAADPLLDESAPEPENLEDEDMEGQVYVDVDEDDDVEDEYDEDDYDESNVALHFDDGLDPLSFINDNSEGYEQFERLELEALASRKKHNFGTDAVDGERAPVFGFDVDEITDVAATGKKSRRMRKKKGRKKGSKTGMTKEVHKKLGDATYFFSKEQYHDTIQILLEVVKLVPNLPESYKTLGLCYNALGNRKKSLQFFLLAAHLDPKDTEQWIDIAKWSKEDGNPRQAMYCLVRALRSDKSNYEARWQRALLFLETGNQAKGLAELERIAAENADEPDRIHKLSRAYNELGYPAKAITVLETLISEHPANANLTSVNILAELYMAAGLRSRCEDSLQLIAHARARFASGGMLPLDLETKEGVCRAYLGDFDTAMALFEPLLSGDIEVEEYTDLIHSAGSALLAMKKPELAISFFSRLLGSPSFDQVLCHFKVGECYSQMGNNKAGIEELNHVLSYVPGHVDARIALSDCLLKDSQFEDAVSVISPPSGMEACEEGEEGSWWASSKVRLARARLFLALDRPLFFLQESMALIHESVAIEQKNAEAMLEYRRKHPKPRGAKPRNFDFVLTREGLFQDFEPPAPRTAAGKEYLASRRRAEKETLFENAAEDLSQPFEIPEPAPVPILAPLPGLMKIDSQFELIFTTCRLLQQHDREPEAKSLATAVLQLAKGVSKHKKLKLRALFGGSKEGEVDHVLDRIRLEIAKEPNSNSKWNAYFQRLQVTREPPHRHFRHIKQYSGCFQSLLILGHQKASSGFSQGALKDYLKTLKIHETDPFLLLCAGTAMLSLSSGSRIPNRSRCIFQAFAFLYKYLKHSPNKQEAHYNLGRAYQQIGLQHYAIPHYKMVLSETVDHATSIANETDPSGMPTASDCGCCDLKREAAHNLALIYKGSGAVALARQLYKDYVTV